MTRENAPGDLWDVLTSVARTLPNGLKTIVLRLPHLHAVSLAFMVRSGPRHETARTNGISHLVEHLVFRGTAKYPDSYKLNTALEALGGEVNGLTQRDACTIHLTLPPGNARAGLEILGEICTRPLLSGIEVERDVVMEEILDTCDANGLETDIDTLSRGVLWAGHAIGMPVAGPLRNVERFTEAQCRSHYERTFVADNGVLVIAGPVEPEQMFRTAERAFGALPRGKRLANGAAPIAARGTPMHVLHTEDSQVSALLTFPAPHENDPDFAALLLLRRILDDGLASRLRQAVCEQRGLAYSLSASIDAYADVGALDLDASCAPRKLVRTVRQMFKTLEELIAEGIDEAELERAKTRHQAELEFALDDPSELCGWYGATELIGCQAGYDERLREALSVSSAEIDALAQRIFDPKRALVVLVGPVAEAQAQQLERVIGRRPGSTVWVNGGDEEPRAAPRPARKPTPRLRAAS